jgi:hypothetical protein
MNVFLSHSHEDQIYTDKIAIALKQAGHNVWYDNWDLNPGDNIITKIDEGLKSADVLILVVSDNSLNSEWVKKEFSAIAFSEISKGSRRIIPVLIDKSSVPSYLASYLYIDFTTDFEQGLKELINALSEDKKEEREKNTKNKNKVEIDKISYDKDMQSLKEALKEGCLTLVCGAGISIEAQIPPWNELLLKLLEAMMNKISDNYNIPLDADCALEFNKRYSSSTLIFGKYLKSILGNDFLNEVRNALYPSEIYQSQIINAIINLARPQRDRKPLDSIITFNFDSLIEENLEKQNISYTSIYSEGMKFKPDQLPVYHVHGYLPRIGEIPSNSNIVFSEDAYHSQFIDHFSWSNLIQLNKLSQNTCLFVGLSLTDPNLRRLLDVANRKNPDKNLNHYIIKKGPNKSASIDRIDEVAYLLEEQDANELGLNMIWVNNFDDISKVLNEINIA